MSLDQLPAHDAIIAALKTIPGAEVYEGQYLTDGAIPNLDVSTGLFAPYITTVFGATYEGDSRGITSERLNTMATSVTVYVVSPDDRISRDYLGLVRDKLVGFIPPDSTQLKPNGGYIFVDADLGVNRYVHSAVFAYSTNMSYT